MLNLRNLWNESNIVRLSTFLNPLANSSRLATFDNGKFEAEMIPLLFDSLNLTYQLGTPDELISGTLLANGTWTGCMGQIQRQEVDICVSLSSPSSSKSPIADFSFPWMYEKLTILMPPPTEIHKVALLIAPFSWEVWIGLAVCGFCMIIALYLAHLRQSFNSPIFWGLILFGNRAGYYLTESHTKVFSLLMLTWFLPAMVLSSGYKAVFFSMLTVPHYTSLVDNVEQLIQNPDIVVHVIRDASVQELFLKEKEFKTFGDQLRRNHIQQTIPRVNLTQTPKIIKGRKVFIAPESEALSIWRLDPKSLVRCPKSFYPRQRSMFHQKNSPLTPPIDYQLMLLHQHGLVDYQVKRTMPGLIPPERTPKKEPAPLHRLSLYDLSGGFILLAVGWIITIIIFFIERFIKQM